MFFSTNWQLSGGKVFSLQRDVAGWRGSLLRKIILAVLDFEVVRNDSFEGVMAREKLILSKIDTLQNGGKLQFMKLEI